MREIEYGDSTFRINKLLPEQGEMLFVKHLIPLISKILSGEADPQPKAGQSVSEDGLPASPEQMFSPREIVRGLSDLPYHHYASLKQTLFSVITYKRQDMDTWMPLRKDEANAFQNCEPVHIILLVGEAVAENFTGSFSVIRSQITRLGGLIPSLSEPET